MAFSSPTGGPRKSRSSFRPMAEINVTPMVDVMLVLLVIFMVSAPLMNSGVPVDLPANNAPALQEKEEPILITLTRKRELFLGDKRVTSSGLFEALKKETAGNKEARLYLRADQGLSYGDVMETMGDLQKAGYQKIALVSEQKTAGASRR